MTQEESDGAKAWRTRYIDLYDRQCDTIEAVRCACGLVELGNADGARDMLGALLHRHDSETEELCRG